MNKLSLSDAEASGTFLKKIGGGAGKALVVLLVMLVILVIGLYGTMWVLVKGPSPTAKTLFVRSVKETSAVGFLANLYLTDAEIDEITGKSAEAETEATSDSALITVGAPTDGSGAQENPGSASSDAYPLPDYATQRSVSDGIEIAEIKAASFKGVMMIVSDPKRLFVGKPENYGTDSRGISLSDMIKNSGAVGGVNAGGFYDPSGGGNGGTPDGIVICDGSLVWGDASTGCSVIGFDAEGVLHVGTMTGQSALDAGLVWAVSFGPALVVNGTPSSGMASGVNPRTAIGQRADGTVLLLVIDGRQVDSLGATFEDLADIMLDFGAVNASNLDGGSSTLMIYNGETLNVCASVYGPRALATAFLIK